MIPSRYPSFKLNAINVIRILIGLVFIFSGFIKINDPLGFSYKLEEYFEVFSLEFLHNYALFFSIFFCTLEIVLGLGLIIGYRPKLILPALLGLILFFTFLTFYSAFYNKVTECGCFGDAIKMTPWQSFYKNLALTFFILILWIYRKTIIPFWNGKIGFWILGMSKILTLGFGLYAYLYLPVWDFLPYKVGKNLPAEMEIPKGMAGDEFGLKYTLKNRKTGEEKEIWDKEYIQTKIYENPDWVYVKASDPILIKPGYQAPVKDLKITDAAGNDHTQEIVKEKGYTLWIVEYDLWHSDLSKQVRINELSSLFLKHGGKVLGLSANLPKEANSILLPYQNPYAIYFCDAVPLKTMVRSNPGLILLKNGTVLGKWSSNALPSFQFLQDNFLKKP